MNLTHSWINIIKLEFGLEFKFDRKQNLFFITQLKRNFTTQLISFMKYSLGCVCWHVNISARSNTLIFFV